MTNDIEMKGLREIRKKKGYSQLKVAMDLSISREALSFYENGKRSPDLQMLISMSEDFDVSIHYLVTGKEFCPKYLHGL
ncbi:MAG: helix-turn-helix transcriptional regulator, partial [Clostridia bacterium]|nr:helix-turn-helix transcriptional regulator [Clostridia bacterium]